MHTLPQLAADLGSPASEVHAVFAGLNHLCWLLDVRHEGPTDLYPRLRRLVRGAAGGRTRSRRARRASHQPVSADLLATFGRYPAPGDRHVASSSASTSAATRSSDGVCRAATT